MNLPPPLPAPQLPLPQWAYVPGEMDEADADHDTLWQAKALVPARFRDFVPARHPALRYGIALNHAGYFWESQEILGGGGGGVWGGAAGRPRSDPAARLHPDRQRQSQAPDAQAACASAAVERGAGRT